MSAKYALDALSIYRSLLQDSVVSRLKVLLDYITNSGKDVSSIVNKYNDFYLDFTNRKDTHTLSSYLINAVLFDENVFTRGAEVKELDEIEPHIRNAADYDLQCLHKIASLSAEDIKAYLIENNPEWDFEAEIIMSLPSWNFGQKGKADQEVEKVIEEFNAIEDWSLNLKGLADFYRKNGTGLFAKYKGFTWDKQANTGKLTGIPLPDPVRLSDLIGYQAERKIIIKNTVSFLKGYPANNILLYGDRGTGKSSTVKALLNEYSSQGLRVIELNRMQVTDFPQVLRVIKGRQQKFIIFIDDLAFEDSEESYTSLKAVLEGGLESRPRNVVIYATSNRRHLIKETFSDRENEIHGSDTIQEKLSLSDRFGITVTFLSPDKNKYLEIVEGIARNRGLVIDTEQLKKDALVWEMRYNGRSPRTAKQFVDWLEGQQERI